MGKNLRAYWDHFWCVGKLLAVEYHRLAVLTQLSLGILALFLGRMDPADGLLDVLDD